MFMQAIRIDFSGFVPEWFIVQTQSDRKCKIHLNIPLLGYRFCNRSQFIPFLSFSQHLILCPSISSNIVCMVAFMESKHCGSCMCIMYYYTMVFEHLWCAPTLRLINAFEKCQRFLNFDKLVAFKTFGWCCCFGSQRHHCRNILHTPGILSWVCVESFNHEFLETSRIILLLGPENCFAQSNHFSVEIQLNYLDSIPSKSHLFVVPR